MATGTTQTRLNRTVRSDQPCIVDGCHNNRYVRSLCIMHYARLRKRGAPGDASRERGAHGDGYINDDGYRLIHKPGHSTANSQDRALEHRVVLYDAIGSGTHACHWCGLAVTWGGDPRLVVDHLDENRTNNTRSNLVPSCIQCNAHRTGSAA